MRSIRRLLAFVLLNSSGVSGTSVRSYLGVWPVRKKTRRQLIEAQTRPMLERPDGGRRAAAAPSAVPPRVIRGVNRQRVPVSGREACGDALTFSAPRSARARVEDLLRNHARLGDPVERAGGCFLPKGIEWGAVKLFYDDDPKGAEHFVVQMSGAGVALVAESLRMESLLQQVLAAGCKITRLDVALDLYGVNQRIIERAIASCENNEQCRFKTWKRTESGGSNVEVGRTVYFGARGKNGSGRYGRFYDKGVESQQAQAGRWIRYEVEFTDQCAHDVAYKWAYGTIKDAVACALGAFDFRRKARNRGEREHASRREQCGWWAEFIGSCHAVLVRAKPKEKTIHGYVGWIKTAVLPGVVTYSKMLGLSVEQFLREVVDTPVQYCERKARSQVGREFKLHFESVVPL